MTDRVTNAWRAVVCLIVLSGITAFHASVSADDKPKTASVDPFAISAEDKLKVFESLWSAVNERYFDQKFNGVDWARIKEVYRPRIEAASNKIQLKELLQKMLDELHTSHLQL